MLTEKLRAAYITQINAEFYSWYLYVSMSAGFASQNLYGFAHWMRKQSEEEMTHAMKFHDYVIERDGILEFPAIQSAPVFDKMSPLDIFNEVVKHEEEVTARINNLVELIILEKDFASSVFLQWFVSEQVEELMSVKKVQRDLAKIKDYDALLMLDRELASR
jgi:ferritin